MLSINELLLQIAILAEIDI